MASSWSEKGVLIFRSDEPHRLGTTDIEWASMQPKGPPKYVKGDIVEFEGGGIGYVDKVNRASGGWPCSYACSRVKGKPFHPEGKSAWHYEGDIKRLVKKSSLRGKIDGH